MIQLRKFISEKEEFGTGGTLAEFESLPEQQRIHMSNSALRYVANNPEGFPAKLVDEANRITNEGGTDRPYPFTE